MKWVSSESSASSDAVAERPKQIFGYEVLDFLGTGAGSRIYAVSHPETKQIYAMKHVVPQTEKDQRFVEQLETEYAVGRQVDHPGLRRSVELKYTRTLFRRVTEAGLVLELFDGVPLDRRQPDSIAGIADCFIQTAHALDALHVAGFVHCDLKPNNILRSATRQVKVIDLGQACKVGTAKERIQGTPDYIAPEQVKREPVTIRTDVYNFGATLYWVLTRRNFPTLFTLKKGANSFLLDDKIPTPRELDERVPEPLSNLVMDCVRTNPRKRPADMTEVARRLELVLHVLRKANDRQSKEDSGTRYAMV